jgi:O-antigen biosynthesis protein
MQLTDPPLATNGRKLKICIVTSELHGFFKNGGIGTLNFGLALALSKVGHSVTVALDSETSVEAEKTIEKFKANFNINVELLRSQGKLRSLNLNGDFSHQSAAYNFHLWLSGTSFDIVNMDDYKALGFYALMAKRTGLAHLDTKFICQIHGPRDWLLKGQDQIFDSMQDAHIIDMERFVMRESDFTIATSQYLFDFLVSQGCDFQDKKIYKLQTISPHWLLSEQDLPVLNCKSKQLYQPESIAFFGRQEQRKGFSLFLETIDILQKKGFKKDILIFGKFSESPLGVHSGVLLCQRLKSWSSRVYVYPDLDSEQALKGIIENKSLVLIPSLTDNLPNTVIECISKKIPFITTTSGGQVELLSEDCRQQYLVQPDPRALVGRIDEYFSNSSKNSIAATFSQLPSEIIRKWEQFFCYASEIKENKNNIKPKNEFITICVVHFNQYQLLLQTLKGIEEQDYVEIKLIIVDDGSSCKEALGLISKIEKTGEFGGIKTKVIRNSNTYLGAARNAALAVCETRYIIFMDDDNYSSPKQVSSLVVAIETSQAAAVTCLSCMHYLPTCPDKLFISNEDRWPSYFPLGAAYLSGCFENQFGDANAIYNTEAIRSVGGFFEEKGVPYEDWHCFVKLATRGYRIYVAPFPLMIYRVRTGSMLRSTSPIKPLNMIGKEISYNDTKKWILHYLYQAGMTGSTRSRIKWFRDQFQNRMKLTTGINVNSSKLQEGIDVKNHIEAELQQHNSTKENSLLVTKELGGKVSTEPVHRSIDLKNSCNLLIKVDLHHQTENRNEFLHYLKAVLFFSVNISDLRSGIDYNHVTHHLNLKEGFNTCENSWSGLLLHPANSANNVVAFPSSIPKFVNYIKVGFGILNDKCVDPAFVKVSVDSRSDGKYKSTDFFARVLGEAVGSGYTRKTFWLCVHPDGKEYSAVIKVSDLWEKVQTNSNESTDLSLIVTAKKQKNIDHCHLKITSIEYLI